MKAHKYWSIGAIVTMVGTFYTGYKGLKAAHKYWTENKKRRKNGRQTCKLAKLAASPHTHTCAYIII